MNHNLLFTETLATANNNSPTETLPVQFDSGVEVDPNLNNFTRSDANCDKTGTCYDGKRFNLNFLSFSLYRLLHCK